VRSTGGAPWETLGGGLPGCFNRLPLLAGHMSQPGALYVASAHGQVWHSADCGDTWKALPFNLGDIWFRLVVT
jgi:hypothetical protein